MESTIIAKKKNSKEAKERKGFESGEIKKEGKEY